MMLTAEPRKEIEDAIRRGICARINATKKPHSPPVTPDDLSGAFYDKEIKHHADAVEGLVADLTQRLEASEKASHFAVCSYCGKVSDCGSAELDAKRKVAMDHILECDKRPENQLIDKCLELELQLAELREREKAQVAAAYERMIAVVRRYKETLSYLASGECVKNLATFGLTGTQEQRERVYGEMQKIGLVENEMSKLIDADAKAALDALVARAEAKGRLEEALHWNGDDTRWIDAGSQEAEERIAELEKHFTKK